MKASRAGLVILILIIAGVTYARLSLASYRQPDLPNRPDVLYFK